MEPGACVAPCDGQSTLVFWVSYILPPVRYPRKHLPRTTGYMVPNSQYSVPSAYIMRRTDLWVTWYTDGPCRDRGMMEREFSKARRSRSSNNRPLLRDAYTYLVCPIRNSMRRTSMTAIASGPVILGISSAEELVQEDSSWLERSITPKAGLLCVSRCLGTWDTLEKKRSEHTHRRTQANR